MRAYKLREPLRPGGGLSERGEEEDVDVLRAVCCVLLREDGVGRKGPHMEWRYVKGQKRDNLG